MTQKPIQQVRRTGNAILEYTLIGGVICTACIFVLLQTGQNLTSHIGGLKADMQQNIQQSAQYQSHVQSHVSPASDLEQSIRTIANDVQSAEQQAVTTAGSNGTKSKAQGQSNILQTFDPAAENMNQEQQEALKDLANQAHKIAEMQARIEAVSKASEGDVKKFHAARIQYNNDVYSVYYLSSTMFNRELKNYDNLKLKLLQSGSLTNNSLNYINELTNNIQNRASTVNNLTHSNQTDALNSLGASSGTHSDGKRICHTGQLDDTGKQCL